MFVRVLETRDRNAEFGSSLLLANSPMSPKIVNGSFAAIFEFGVDNEERTTGLMKLLSIHAKDSPGRVGQVLHYLDKQLLIL